MQAVSRSSCRHSGRTGCGASSMQPGACACAITPGMPGQGMQKLGKTFITIALLAAFGAGAWFAFQTADCAKDIRADQ